MAALELGIDLAVVSPVRRTRRLGVLFWLAAGWIAFIVLAVIVWSAGLFFTVVGRRVLIGGDRRIGVVRTEHDAQCPELARLGSNDFLRQCGTGRFSCGGVSVKVVLQ